MRSQLRPQKQNCCFTSRREAFSDLSFARNPCQKPLSRIFDESLDVKNWLSNPFLSSNADKIYVRTRWLIYAQKNSNKEHERNNVKSVPQEYGQRQHLEDEINNNTKVKVIKVSNFNASDKYFKYAKKKSTFAQNFNGNYLRHNFGEGFSNKPRVIFMLLTFRDPLKNCTKRDCQNNHAFPWIRVASHIYVYEIAEIPSWRSVPW